MTPARTTPPAKGSLLLVPTTLGDVPPEEALPLAALVRVRSLRYIIAENPKTARQFLKRAGMLTPIQDIRIERLDEHTPEASLPALLEPLMQGQEGGLLSDAGCPVVADPGAPLIRLAHRAGIRVIPLIGPSSIVLGLMASGLGGQRFAFHGYLPVEEALLMARLRALEKEAGRLDQTQAFIETPYRNDRMLAIMLRSLNEATRVCVACDLTLPAELVMSRTVREWRAAPPPPLKDRPCVFLLGR